ncbi:hypothetical protein HMPREF9349_05004 [Escherichia coli MS 79-10]|nr:hypothetical protein HMPREF9348_01261 [Escherichia coli MS 145-7]EGU95106.1 hypothetical protein HMPREF9349_05004 [Escherichia coli MS 79-10]ESD29600.1 hypothetical protein HMPREF1600_01139 [Escherichia coli 907715]ESD65733.1 hypothetical protein HMPREF1609_05085 [Escherichia coli 908541]
MWQLIFARCFCEQLLSGLFVFVYLFSYRSDHFFSSSVTLPWLTQC